MTITTTIAVPKELEAIPQWANWRYEQQNGATVSVMVRRAL